MNKRAMILLLAGVFLITVGGIFLPRSNSEAKEDVNTEPQTEQKESKKSDDTNISLVFTGDFLWEQGLYDSMDNYQFGDYFDEVKPLLDSDLTIANQEVPIGGEELGISGVAYTFNAPYEIANQYPSIGIDYMTFATNHTVDMGQAGVDNTLSILDQNGIGHTGAYSNEEDANNISVIEIDGIKIAILAYTYGTNQYAEFPYSVNYFLNGYGEFDQEHQDKLALDVARARESADVVIAAMHWGTEFTYDINPVQAEVAAFLNEQGVDIIVGNHPHCIQPAETLVNSQGKETIVFYSLGNFVSSAAQVDRADEQFQNMYEIGAVAGVNVVKDKEGIHFENVHITPVVNHFEYGYTNFKLIPFSKYTEELASQHYQRYYSELFTIDYLKEQIHSVFDSSGFVNADLS